MVFGRYYGHPLFSIIFMKISAMKNVLIGFLSIFLVYSVQAQTPANATQAPYLVNPGIPLFRLLKVDSIHYVTKDDIKRNRKVLMIFFSPDCEHCKHQTRDILADFDKFKDVRRIEPKA